MGALTSKPYAFRGRPWETKNLEFFDLFSPIYSPLRLDVRGLQILRVLPYYSNWITDQARFSYDSFRFQRLLNPSITTAIQNTHNINYQDSLNESNYFSWISLFNMFRLYYIKHFSLIQLFVGRFLDHTASLVLTSFSQTIGNSIIMADHFQIENDLPMSIFLPEVSSISNFSCILIYNSNIRLESPLIAAQLRSHPHIYSLGIASSSNFPLNTISVNYNSDVNIITGKHPILKTFLKFKSFLIIGGNQLANSYKLSSFRFKYSNYLLHQLSKNKWNGIFSFLSLAPSLTVYNLYPVFPLFHFKSFNLFFLFSSKH